MTSEENKKIDEMIDRSIAQQKAEDKKQKAKTEKSKKESKPEKAKEKPEEKNQSEKKEEGGVKENPETKEPAKGEIVPKGDPWKVLKYPSLAEKAMNLVETENKLIFIVKRSATKEEILEAVEDGFDVEVMNVRTQITRKGEKKAYIKLSPNYEASDVATRLGMI